MKLFYFGCWEQKGHFIHTPERSYRADTDARKAGVPWEDWTLDGGLCPGSVWDARSDRWNLNCRQPQGAAALHHKDGWTALSFWDRSVDSRTNSNSCFIAEGTHTFEEMVALAQLHFPTIWGRFPFEVKLA